MGVGHLLFGFSGRINRAKYWLWVLLYIIALIIVGIIAFVAMSANSGGMTAVAGIVQLVFGIAAFISSLAVMTKRLHDRDKSAWWLLIFVVAPTILILIGVGASLYGVIISGGEPGGGVPPDLGNMGMMGGILSLIAAALMLWAFVELACLRGTVGPNRYGPDPLGAL